MHSFFFEFSYFIHKAKKQQKPQKKLKTKEQYINRQRNCLHCVWVEIKITFQWIIESGAFKKYILYTKKKYDGKVKKGKATAAYIVLYYNIIQSQQRIDEKYTG